MKTTEISFSEEKTFDSENKLSGLKELSIQFKYNLKIVLQA